MIDTRLGRVLGTEADGVHSFLGVPYAQPPVGEGRWRPPRPVGPRAELDATRHGPRCLQTPYHEVLAGFELHGEESEDCLVLNIHTPDPAGRRPVMVWIHGGAFIQGSANEYDGSRLAARQDVVVVSINYRLGIFGFLDLARYGADYAGSASLGIQDQIAALRWVRDNIEDYGGDPTCVTIFGESAGGSSVLALCAAPAAEGLFHRAAALSPGEVLVPPLDNVAALAAHAQVPADGLLDHLLALPGEDLRTLQVNNVFNAGISVDGTVITRSASAALAEADARVPLLIGSCRDEGSLFMPMFPPAVNEMIAYGLAVTAGNGDAAHYLARRDALMADADGPARVQQTWTDLFRASVLRCAQAASEGGGPGAWVYRFDVPTEHPLGITHGSDIPFVFDQLVAGGLAFHDVDSAANQRLVELWSGTLARFARSGDPNGPGLPGWPRYDAASRACLMFEHAPHVAQDPDGPGWRDAYGMVG